METERPGLGISRAQDDGADLGQAIAPVGGDAGLMPAMAALTDSGLCSRPGCLEQRLKRWWVVWGGSCRGLGFHDQSLTDRSRAVGLPRHLQQQILEAEPPDQPTLNDP